MPNNEQSTPNIEYSNQVVFFIDILAFKDMIQGEKNEQPKILH